ncbi:hypothetical protein IVA80_29345 [Bradyrhizobium sp. 139]|uniref:hypothetical protein n=1 Tax=Bradyrhizobium sp. 139 TaxID=2782616 RepID=UPI001FF76A4E|nr:hypothetical protein [Bradyrhizobium sp. 139]MCK1744813.1 hypothetical protein [Bradyrhizobium sp. 139]
MHTTPIPDFDDALPVPCGKTIEPIEPDASPLARQRSCTVQDLLLAGCAALGVWTVWANGPIGLVVGNPLEQAQLIRQLFAYIFDTDLSSVKANILHCVIGAIIYPLGYWLLLSSGWYRPPFDGWLWGLTTFVFPMGAFALISERPFLLIDNSARLSLMILIGHVLYGLALSRIYHALRASRAITGVRDR